jgi:hypothetical protein
MLTRVFVTGGGPLASVTDGAGDTTMGEPEGLTAGCFGAGADVAAGVETRVLIGGLAVAAASRGVSSVIPTGASGAVVFVPAAAEAAGGGEIAAATLSDSGSDPRVAAAPAIESGRGATCARTLPTSPDDAV